MRCWSVLLTIPILLIINTSKESDNFLRNIFLAGLLLRVMLATLLRVSTFADALGPDALTYDEYARDIIKYWNEPGSVNYALGIQQNNLTMSYLTASIYYLTGRAIFAPQLFNAVIGAATAPIIYYCSYTIFRNIRAARLSACLVAFFPSLVLWSSLGLKDSLIVFLLAVTALCTLKLLEKFHFPYAVILVASLFGLLGLRFYVFYMMIISIAGGFLLCSKGIKGSAIARQIVLVFAVGMIVISMGAFRNTSNDLDSYTDLKKIQSMRHWGANASASGYGRDVDISTPTGAISFLPIGILYVLLAPFPWQMTNVGQIIALPEMLIWWSTTPFLISGLVYSIRHKLRNITPLLLFMTLLTLVYALFQSNVGTAYRQRSQLLIFYLIFTAVGIVLWQERKENKQKRGLKIAQNEQVRYYLTRQYNNDLIKRNSGRKNVRNSWNNSHRQKTG